MNYRNDTERSFGDWLTEAVKAGLIQPHWAYEPESFLIIPKKTYFMQKQLKTKVKLVEKHLCASLTYTPDFSFRLTSEGARLFSKIFEKSLHTSGTYLSVDPIYVDTKGSNNGRHDEKALFSIKQKIFYETHGIWAEKIIPDKLFKATFSPDSVRHKKNGQINAVGKRTRSIEQFVQDNKLLL
jgi:hypothetical protein